MLDYRAFYLPVARILPQARVVRERLLPRAGEATVSAEQRVEPVDVVARAYVPDSPRVYNIAQMFKVRSSRARALLLKKPGEAFEKNEVIARHKSLIGQARVIRAPAPGRLLEEHEGEVLLEMMPAPLELPANIKGVVANASRFGVVIQTFGALVQGVWGNGKESYGILKLLGETREQPLAANLIDVSCLGTIVVVGGALEAEGLKQAETQQVRGVVAGSMPATLRDSVLAAPFPVMVTEGFGCVAMANPAFQLLRASNAREAALRAVSQTRWGAARPEVVVPLSARESLAGIEAPRPVVALQKDVKVRVCAGEHLGRDGRIVGAPSARDDERSPHITTRTFESGIRARAVAVELEGGETVWAPINNLEALA